MILLYFTALIILTVFSFGFVDANFPIKLLPLAFQIIHQNRAIASALYVALISFLFYFYVWLIGEIRRKRVNRVVIFRLIGLTCLILFFSYPAFSYDIFNYIATAKITYFYRENPYVIMPIDISNEPMLAFMHAANKVALYGPTWILLTAVSHFAGLGYLLVSIVTFKAFVAVFYLWLCWLIYKTSQNDLVSLSFFAFNPLVIIETLISGHNDVVMMSLALFSFYLAKKKRCQVGLIFLLLSILVKFATLALLPVYTLLWWRIFKKQDVSWVAIWRWSAILMLVAFLLSPVREELYPWYFIWPLTFISLLSKTEWLTFVSYGFTFGLNLRFAPYIYFGEWGGWVPWIKKLVSIAPPTLTALFYAKKK